MLDVITQLYDQFPAGAWAGSSGERDYVLAGLVPELANAPACSGRHGLYCGPKLAAAVGATPESALLVAGGIASGCGAGHEPLLPLLLRKKGNLLLVCPAYACRIDNAGVLVIVHSVVTVQGRAAIAGI